MSSDIAVLFPKEGESWRNFIQRMRRASGEIVVILSGYERVLCHNEEDLTVFLASCTDLSGRLRIATKYAPLIVKLQEEGIRVLDRTQYVRAILENHEQLPEILRLFSPNIWRQQLRSQLQHMGLLSLPRLRIYALTGISLILMVFVLFYLLPSAKINVWPREESISQTANIFLILSGATTDLSSHVRTMPLIPIVMRSKKALTFDQISKRFIGERSALYLAIVNQSDQSYSFLKGTRFMNQAGVVFRTQDPMNIVPGEKVEVRARADDVDFYGEVIGERGNVPAGLRWEIPGLATQERTKIFATNEKPGVGGTTAYRTVLEREDLETAQKYLEKELLKVARQMAQEEVTLHNTQEEGIKLELLDYPELTRISYEQFVFPEEFLGQPVTTVPVEGEIVYTIFSYDAQAILNMLRDELNAHVQDGRRLLARTLSLDRLVVHVIDYPDDLSWIKLTVDLTGTERYVLDPISPTGARFGKKVREWVKGLPIEDAEKILRNMPEVQGVEVSVWPPWSKMLPEIAAHISIEPQDDEAQESGHIDAPESIDLSR